MSWWDWFNVAEEDRAAAKETLFVVGVFLLLVLCLVASVGYVGWVRYVAA